MSAFDRFVEKFSRRTASRYSRRSLLAKIGALAAGASAAPLLPVARASTPSEGGYDGVLPQTTGDPNDPGDPTSCDYWRYCAVDGFLCSCCGGTPSACPPGTEMSPITWIGTCENPADGVKYIISYNDCCGRTGCGRCVCNRNEGDRPLYRPQANNDVNWCLGTESSIYHCSTAVVIGVALDQ
ncbi:MAG: methylamine dehydrogenase light chain [Pseudomonadota bacterium]